MRWCVADDLCLFCSFLSILQCVQLLCTKASWGHQSDSQSWNWTAPHSDQRAAPDLNVILMLWWDLKLAVHEWMPTHLNTLKQWCKQEWTKDSLLFSWGSNSSKIFRRHTHGINLKLLRHFVLLHAQTWVSTSPAYPSGWHQYPITHYGWWVKNVDCKRRFFRGLEDLILELWLLSNH